MLNRQATRTEITLESAMMNRRSFPFIAVALAVCCCLVSAGRKPGENAGNSPPRSAEKKALEEFNSLIGGWRGVGQPKRNSTRGAWIESAEWVWDFSKKGVAVRYVVEKGRLLQSARLTYDTKRRQYVLTAMLADKVERTYRGLLEKGGKLVLVSDPDNEGKSYRLTVTRLRPTWRRSATRRLSGSTTL